MAYDINLTSGNLLATLNDGEINTSACSLSLIGRNVSVYGERINENLVRLLENFANTTAPSAPLNGQLWYDLSSKQLKLYSSSTWQGLNTYIKSATQPTGLELGDLWYDSTTGQVKIKETSGFRLLGPIAPAGFGDTKLVAESLPSIDSSGNHEVLSMYVDGTSLLVFSDDSQYTTDQTGFGTVKPGININTAVASAVLNGTATNASALNNLTSSQFMRSDIDTSNSGNVTLGKLILASGQGQFYTSNVSANINGNLVNFSNGSSDFTIISNIVNNVGLGLRAKYFGIDKDFVIVDSENNKVIINSDMMVLGSFNAPTASTLASSVTIGLTGNILGSVSFDGSTNVNIVTTHDVERLKITGGTMTGLLNADQGFVASSPSTGNLIYATGSKVGILNNDPKVALDVVGAIRSVPVVTSGNGSITVDGLHTNHQLNLDGATTISFSNFNEPGQIIRIVLIGTENVISWDAPIYWPNGVNPNLSNGEYKIAVVTLMKPNAITASGPRPDNNFILATYVSY